MPTFPIVGAHFRPPAKAILQILKLGAPLILRPEPENPFDPHAIAVWVSSDTLADCSLELLDQLAIPMGSSAEEILTHQPEWHLGYIPKTEAASLRFASDTPGRLAFGLNGAPHIEFTIPRSKTQ